jgi:hypothetical protein
VISHIVGEAIFSVNKVIVDQTFTSSTWTFRCAPRLWTSAKPSTPTLRWARALGWRRRWHGNAIPAEPCATAETGRKSTTAWLKINQ